MADPGLMNWQEVLQTQGPLALGAVMRFCVAWLNARSLKIEDQEEEK